MNFLHIVGKPDILPNEGTAHPSEGGRGICLKLCILTVLLQHAKVKGSLAPQEAGDLICMSQKHQVNMSLTSEEVHEVLSDVTIGCKDSAYSRRSRRSWRAWRALSSVRHQVLEDTSA